VSVETCNHRNIFDIYNFAIKTDGSLWGWGHNSSWGNLGIGMRNDEYINKPIKIMDNVVMVSFSESATFAIKEDGTLWFWGLDFYTEESTSDPSLTTHNSPVMFMDNVAVVSAGTTHVLIVKTDGTLWAAGANNHGQLGIGTVDDALYPPRKIMDNVTSISADVFTSAAIKTDGSLFVWGANYAFGDADFLGIDSTTVQTQATPVKILDEVASIDTGHLTSLAIKKDRSLYAWGVNYSGAVGDGTAGRINGGINEVRTSPVKIMDDIIQASAGAFHSIAEKTDGSLWTWGMGWHGELGDGQSGYSPYHEVYTPQKIMDGVKLPTAATAPTPTTPTAPTVNPTPSTVYVNGAAKAFEAYNIGGNNFFKLRDLAMTLNGTAKQFEVGYDNATRAITLTTGQPYTPAGGELVPGDGTAKAAVSTPSKLYLNGTELNLTAYNISGNNFFKLRDLMQAIDVYVDYDDATRAITLDTGRGYVEE
jgi:hypothetical protein